MKTALFTAIMALAFITGCEKVQHESNKAKEEIRHDANESAEDARHASQKAAEQARHATKELTK